jgi:hypothetical protein
VNTNQQITQLSEANYELLVEALHILRELVAAAENDVFTDSPERASSVSEAEEAIRQAHQVFQTLEQTAWQILQEAEEAFYAISRARAHAANGNWPTPRSIADYMLWIQDEWEVQNHLVAENDPVCDPVYANALLNLVGELHGLGFKPSPVPWQLAMENTQLEMA